MKMERTILHIDINSCYASIECLYQPALRGRPVAVGGDVQMRHGIILAKNEPAKRTGVQTGEALWQALRKCPELVILPPRHKLYARFSRMAREIYSAYSDRIEPFGLDEAWLDVTGTQKLDRGVRGLADEIRERVRAELGITVSVGASYNKVFAKLGSDYRKPDATTVFTRENFRELIWPLPVGALLYVGRATANRLAGYGIRTIGDLARTDPDRLEVWLGKSGLTLSAFANGQDTAPVARAGEEAQLKSIGNSATTARDMENEADVRLVLYALCESVAARLRETGFLAGTVQLQLRDTLLRTVERQMQLPAPTCLSGGLHATAMQILRANYRWQKPLRSVGIQACTLQPAGAPEQLSLFAGEDHRRLTRLEETVDDIRRRFGHDAICRAAVLTDPALTDIRPGGRHALPPAGANRGNGRHQNG